MAGDFAAATAGKIKAFTVTTNSTSLRAMYEAGGRVNLVCFMSRNLSNPCICQPYAAQKSS